MIYCLFATFIIYVIKIVNFTKVNIFWIPTIHFFGISLYEVNHNTIDDPWNKILLSQSYVKNTKQYCKQ